MKVHFALTTGLVLEWGVIIRSVNDVDPLVLNVQVIHVECA
jgi:hypothetical protein